MSDSTERHVVPGSLLSEGVGAPPPRRAEYVAVEHPWSSHLGSNVKDEIVEAINNWLSVHPDTRNHPGPVYQLHTALTAHPKKRVFETVKANFHGSARDDAKVALRAAGLLS